MRIRSPASERRLRLLFVWSILGKGLDGIIEIIVGMALVFRVATMHVISWMIQDELIEDPADFIARAIQHHLVPFLAHKRNFAAAYLLSHGLVKLFLVLNLIRNRLWAYPAAIIVFLLFVAYQVYRLCIAPSPMLVLLTALDLIVIGLTWHEYRVVLSDALKKFHLLDNLS
jgi:uncharacterized membrane protein